MKALWAWASRDPFVANSIMFEDIAGRHISAIAAGLPPDVVAEAQERGRTGTWRQQDRIFCLS